MPKNSAARSSFIDRNFWMRDDEYVKYLTEDGFARFKTYYGTVLRGQNHIFTAPFAKGQNMTRVMGDWDKILVSIKATWPSLYSFEKDLAKKVGPMSIQKPLEERMQDIDHYYEDITLPQLPVPDFAMRAVVQEFSSVGSLRLRDQQSTIDLMKKSTNSGTPFWTKRRNVVRDTLPCKAWLDVRHKSVVQDLDVSAFDAVAGLGWRGQEGGPTTEDVKQRVVWMFPFGINLCELQVYQPFIEKSQHFKIVPAWVSNDEVDKRITNLFDTKSRKDLVVCTDFSRFDQHFNPEMQACARTILHSLLATGKVSNQWIADIFPIKYSIPLVLNVSNNDELEIRYGTHGMASGSGGTNVDETLAHRALQYEAAISKGKVLNPNSQCLGDDGILSYPGITVEDVVETYQSHGQVCNLDKQYASTQDCVYLRRWHHVDYRVHGVCAGVYSTMRALGRLRYLERFMDPEYWSPELVALRQLSILENCKYHPLKEEFAQFCMERDKYRLGIDIPGFLENVSSIAEEATDHMQDFLGYTKTLQGEGPSSISDWWIVKYLKSVR